MREISLNIMVLLDGFNRNPEDRLVIIEDILELLQELSLCVQNSSPKQILADELGLVSLGDFNPKAYLEDLDDIEELTRIKENLESTLKELGD